MAVGWCEPLTRARFSRLSPENALNLRLVDGMDPARVQRLHNEPAMAISHRKELREDPSMKVTRIGLDIAKQIFELCTVSIGVGVW